MFKAEGVLIFGTRCISPTLLQLI